jgi:hypothetical protein
MSIDRIVVVVRPTRYEELLEKYHTAGAARFELESKGGDIAPYLREHETCLNALQNVLKQLPRDLPVCMALRKELPYFLFRPTDMVIVCGPDGLLVNTARFLENQPVLGVNLDPAANAGVLTSCLPSDVRAAVAAALSGACRVQALPFVRATSEEGATLWGLNEIFAGRLDHVSARYRIRFEGAEESQVSSGVITASGVGCGGWMRSIAAMIQALCPEAALSGHRLTQLPLFTDKQAVFAVREPFPSLHGQASLVTGRLQAHSKLELISEMPDGGVILSDGLVERAVNWPAGTSVTITVGERTLNHICV